MPVVTDIDRVDGNLGQLAVAAAAGTLTVASWLIVPHPAVPIAVAAVPLALAVAYYRPFLLCLVFVAFSFFRLHEAFPVLYPLQIPLAVAALSFLP